MNQNRLEVSYEGEYCYSIIFEHSYEGLGAELKKLGCAGRKICIVTDSNVGILYQAEVLEVLSSCGLQTAVVFTFPAGEESKNLDTVKELYEFLIEHHFDRNDLLAALGGGVVGDLTGYAAATYLRGIRFIQLPTSLLAMVDSSVGGKTGVDFNAYKNMVGAFHMPKLVYMNLTALKTLNDRLYYAGFGEVIKHALIKDSSYFSWLLENRTCMEDREPNAVAFMVRRNCEIKANVVENDPKEQGERALLNFGHTIGHAIEKLKNFTILHGECVAIGMIAASYISFQRGNLSNETFHAIISLLKAYKLPISADSLRISDVMTAAAHDKKKDGKTLKFILLSSLGKGMIDTSVSQEEIMEAVGYVLNSEGEE